MRKFLWRLHSVMGLIAGLGLVLIGLTGVLLVFMDELDSLLFPAAHRVEATAEGRLPLRALVNAAEDQLPGYAVTGWDPQYENPARADGFYVIAYGTHDWLYATANPYTGDVLSGPLEPVRTLRASVLELHYTFLLGDTGMAITGALGVLLCLLGVSGLWLYRRFWKTLFRLRLRSSLRMLTGDIHRLTGVLSVGFNLLLGFTGAYWNLSHVIEDLLQPHLPPAEEFVVPGRLLPRELDLDALLVDAQTRIPGFETHYVSLPWAPEGAVTLWGQFGGAGWFRSPHGSQVAYQSTDGTFTSANDIRTQSTWAQVVDAFEPLHYGNFGGLPVKIVYGLAGCAPAVLAISGVMIWWQRRRGKTSRPSSDKADPAA